MLYSALKKFNVLLVQKILENLKVNLDNLSHGLYSHVDSLNLKKLVDMDMSVTYQICHIVEAIVLKIQIFNV